MSTNRDYRRYLEQFISERRGVIRAVREGRKSLRLARQYVRNVERAQAICQDIAKLVQQKAHEKLASVVTRCLHAVFPNPYDFKIVFEKKRGKTDARMVFIRDGKEMDPEDGVGGSVLDVAAFALRLACLGLQKPKRRKFVVIDEGFRGVSDIEDNKNRVKEMLEILSQELGFQILQITHDEGLKAGKVITI